VLVVLVTQLLTMHSPVHQGLILLSHLLLLLVAVLVLALPQMVLLGRVGLVVAAAQMVLAVQEIVRLQVHRKEIMAAVQMFHQLITTVAVGVGLVLLEQMSLVKLAGLVVMD
jgi:hypothetical protein